MWKKIEFLAVNDVGRTVMYADKNTGIILSSDIQDGFFYAQYRIDFVILENTGKVHAPSNTPEVTHIWIEV